MSLVAKLLGGLLGLLVAAIALGFVLPSQVHVERTMAIAAPPETVFAWVSDFHRWEAWSPWATKDPDATMQINGSGVGQTMVWHSDQPEVGSGSQEIVELRDSQMMKTHLEFGDRGRADATFTLQPRDGKTLVTWSLDSDMRDGVPTWQQPLNTYMGFLMDSLLGHEYETGLQQLKAIAEADNPT